MHTERRQKVRVLALGFTLALSAVLAIWSYGSFAANPASLTVSPSAARQNDTVTLVGQGFSPGETVSVWITYPDFRVFGVAEVEANGDGAFSYPYLPDFLSAKDTPTGKFIYTARGQRSGREVYADLKVEIGRAPGASTGVKVTALPNKDDQGSYFVFRGEGYGTTEEIALWLRYPDNTVLDLGRTKAGPGGQWEFVVRVTGAPVGHYAFTGRGLRTGLNGITEFDVTVGDATREKGRARLVVRPSGNTQRRYAVFEGAGFRRQEVVTIWVTLPDFSTLWIGDVQVDDDGAFVAELFLSEQLPAGKHTFTAYGNFSGVQGTAPFVLDPGSAKTVQEDPPEGGEPFQVISPDQPEPDNPYEEEPTPAPPPPPPPPAYPAPVF